jgi:transcriptional regulator with AAA-type ATPase domain
VRVGEGRQRSTLASIVARCDTTIATAVAVRAWRDTLGAVDETITNAFEVKPPRERHLTRLVFLTNADDPRIASSYHSLEDLDEVRFHRGPRAVARTCRTLSLTFDDARMSSSHGSLQLQDGRWVLEDPSSKNGTLVNGAIMRWAELADGSVFELGRCFFMFRTSMLAGDPPSQFAGDIEARELPRLATFSPALAADYEAIARLAASTVSIVLCGETGTGKEVIARAIHELSRRAGAFTAVNCGALPPALVEAELFGHRRGAFSGAVSDRRGLVRSSDGGTLFLDEIGELPVIAQAALLRVLQEREVLPVGDDRPVGVDLRVVAATLRDLDLAVDEDRFRGDLRARLAGHVVTLAPLRERLEDLGLLLAALLDRLTTRPVRFAPAALRALLAHDWPDNIRGLEQVLRTALALAATDTIELGDLPATLRRVRPTLPTPTPRSLLPADDLGLRETLVALFAANDGNVLAVARALGKQRAQIYKWIKRFGIDLATFRRA